MAPLRLVNVNANTDLPRFRAFSHTTATILVFQNNETAAMLSVPKQSSAS